MSSTVSSVVATVRDISAIVNNFIQNNPPVWGLFSEADLQQVVNAIYDEIIFIIRSHIR